MSVPTTLIWFRQDLRTDDQPALQAAARSGRPLLGLYVWPNEGTLTARRRYFIWQSLRDLQARLAECGIPLHVRTGNPVQVVAETAAHCHAAEVVCAANGAGQGALRAALERQGCRLSSVPDGLLQPPFQFIRAPYFNGSAFAAFQVAWQAACVEQYAAWQAPAWPSPDLAAQQQRLSENLKIAALPVVPSAVLTIPGGETAAQQQLAEFLPSLPYYAVLRDLPAQHGSSQLSPHLVLGTLSVRRVWVSAGNVPDAAAWREALARREFWQHYFRQYPDVLQHGLPEHRTAARQTSEALMAAWQQGATGYPLVDAAMRLLRDTGWLPHSLRRFCAAFFCCVLGGRWQDGAGWFARQLLDFEPAANSGNWQLAAGMGGKQAERQPFNPVVWSQKLDPDGQFIRRHLPQLAHIDSRRIHAPWLAAAEVNTNGYPVPVVDYRAR